MRVERFLVAFASNDDIAYAISTASRQERAIPAGAEKPERKPRADARSTSLLAALQREREAGLPGGIYHHVQVDLTYNSNHMEGNRLTHDQTRFIFETNTIGFDGAANVDDIVETANHFRCIDMMIDAAGRRISERMVKQLHA